MKQIIERIKGMDIRSVLGLVSVVSVVALLFILCFKPIPHANSELIYMAVGQVLGTGFASVMSYFFGASKPNNNPPKDK